MHGGACVCSRGHVYCEGDRAHSSEWSLGNERYHSALQQRTGRQSPETPTLLMGWYADQHYMNGANTAQSQAAAISPQETPSETC